jgi:hypothetical protein
MSPLPQGKTTKGAVFAALSAATLELTQQIRFHTFIMMGTKPVSETLCVSSVRSCNKNHSYQTFRLVYSCSSLRFFDCT